MGRLKTLEEIKGEFERGEVRIIVQDGNNILSDSHPERGPPTPLTITIVDDVTCPHCGAGEVHPRDPDKLLIRAFKVTDADGHWSQCLVCAGYYDKELNYDQSRGDSNKGWFVTPL